MRYMYKRYGVKYEVKKCTTGTTKVYPFHTPCTRDTQTLSGTQSSTTEDRYKKGTRMYKGYKRYNNPVPLITLVWGIEVQEIQDVNIRAQFHQPTLSTYSNYNSMAGLAYGDKGVRQGL